MVKGFKVLMINDEDNDNRLQFTAEGAENEQEALQMALQEFWPDKAENFLYISGDPDGGFCSGYVVGSDWLIFGHWSVSIWAYFSKIKHPDPTYFDPYPGYDYRKGGAK